MKVGRGQTELTRMGMSKNNSYQKKTNVLNFTRKGNIIPLLVNCAVIYHFVGLQYFHRHCHAGRQ